MICFKNTNCMLLTVLISMLTVLCMCDCSKQLQRSQPQADGGITSSMLKPKMTGEWVD